MDHSDGNRCIYVTDNPSYHQLLRIQIRRVTHEPTTVMDILMNMPQLQTENIYEQIYYDSDSDSDDDNDDDGDEDGDDSMHASSQSQMHLNHPYDQVLQPYELYRWLYLHCR
jgi:hypothetical protein